MEMSKNSLSLTGLGAKAGLVDLREFCGFLVEGAVWCLCFVLICFN